MSVQKMKWRAKEKEMGAKGQVRGEQDQAKPGSNHGQESSPKGSYTDIECCKQ